METTIEVSKMTKELKTITLPYYCKSFAHYYKVFSADKALQVVPSELGRHSIDIVHASTAFCGEYAEITEDQFKVYVTSAVLEIINIFKP